MPRNFVVCCNGTQNNDGQFYYYRLGVSAVTGPS
jgi:hypothetical protein